MRKMLANADLILTARIEGKLVGVSRAITDFAFCTYLSDLAVDTEYQRHGIGRELLRQTHEAAGLHTALLWAVRRVAPSEVPSPSVARSRGVHRSRCSAAS